MIDITSHLPKDSVRELEVALIRASIANYEAQWNHAEDHIRDIALDRLFVEDIEDYVNPSRVDYMTDETWIEDMEWLWKDAISVLVHAEHEFEENLTAE